MKRIILTIILLTGILLSQSAGAGEQLFGFAWSEIGWISFRNDNSNAHFSLVNDNSDVTWVTTNTGSFQYDAYKLDDPIGLSGAIANVQVRVRYRGEAYVGLRLNGVEEVVASPYSNSGGFKWTAAGGEIIARPGGGAWTWQDIENLQVIVGLRKIPSSIDGYISRVEVTVNGTILYPNATGDYTNISTPVPAAPFGYGVEADRSTGALSGYAWSSNIGWISFNSASVTGCDHFVPAGATSCQAYIDFTTNEIYGWARACSVFQSGCSGALKSNSGGWGGWIKFDGSDPLYLSYLDDSLPVSELKNWAWGDAVIIGWVSLNNVNTAGPVSYEVKTNLKLNAPPVASFACEDCSGGSISSCQVYRGNNLCLVNYSSDPDGNATISTCDWYWDDLTDGLGYSWYAGCLPGLTGLTFGGVRGNWNIRLYVQDNKGSSDEDIKQVTVLRDIVASFKCSLDDPSSGTQTWYSCSDFANLSLVGGDTLYLKDTSVASETSFGVNATVNNWTWTIDGGNAGNNSTATYLVQTPGVIIELTARDNNGRTDTKQEVLFGVIPLPTWKEIVPF